VSDRDRLLDILDAIEAIQHNIRGGRASLDDGLTAAAMIRWLEIIGEAATQLSPEFRERHADVPWRGPIDMRNRLIHGYFDIQPDRIWEAINRDLPVLEAKVQASSPKRAIDHLRRTSHLLLGLVRNHGLRRTRQAEKPRARQLSRLHTAEVTGSRPVSPTPGVIAGAEQSGLATVGVREFRDQATAMVSSGEALVIERHGRPSASSCPSRPSIVERGVRRSVGSAISSSMSWTRRVLTRSCSSTR
jgi:uncharacterized protein with HEPN domain